MARKSESTMSSRKTGNIYAMHCKRIWIGLAHVKPKPGNALLDGAAGAFVPVVALADNESEFASSVATFLNAYKFDVIAVEDIELLDSRRQHSTVENEVVELAESLTLDDPIALSEFEGYENE